MRHIDIDQQEIGIEDEQERRRRGAQRIEKATTPVRIGSPPETTAAAKDASPTGGVTSAMMPAVAVAMPMPIMLRGTGDQPVNRLAPAALLPQPRNRA